MGWYKNWFGSPYYRLLYQNRDEQEAQAFVEKLIALLQPAAGSRMLDIACGEGRHARQLAGHGYDVVGIDISGECIQEAKAWEAPNLTFFLQDMRQPIREGYFDYAFNFFTSFGYFEHHEDHEQAAAAFLASLKPGGTLVIDYFNNEYLLPQLVPFETVQRGEVYYDISRRLEDGYIIKDIHLRVVGQPPEHYAERVAAFSLADFKELFVKNGVELVATYGDYQLRPFDAATSPRLIMAFKLVTTEVDR